MNQDVLSNLLNSTALAVQTVLLKDAAQGEKSWRERTERPGQYRIDLVADEAALDVLRSAGVGILSEESGLEDPGNDMIIVVDPVDGSTNASRGIPWYAISLCAIEAGELRSALVMNLATGTRYEAVSGQGASRNGQPITPSAVTSIDDAMLVLNGYSPKYLHWRQYRALGATALDLCSVADGTFDGSMDCTDSKLGPWDYMGALLVLQEVGAYIADAQGRELVVLDPSARRTPVAAGSRELFETLLNNRQILGSW
ncbi:MAG: inositol monophosphatase family protein [Microthrixaceae bacterium]